MKEVELPRSGLPLETATFVACLATILELSFDELPRPADDEDPVTGWTLSRWLGGLGLASPVSPIQGPSRGPGPGSRSCVGEDQRPLGLS